MVGRDLAGRDLISRSLVGQGVAGRDVANRNPVSRNPVGRNPVGRDLVGRELVGRAAELALVDSVLTAGATGPGLLLRGGPGAGKTALLRAAAERARVAGHRVLWATGARAERGFAFSGLHQLLYPVRQDVERLPSPRREVLRRVLADCHHADRLAVSAALLALLAELASAGPVLVVLDDAQWVDPSSAEVLAFVARRLRDRPDRLLAATAADQPTPLAEAGLHDGELPPLDGPAARALLAAHHPDLAPHVRRRVLDEARGNPLALLELPAALAEEQRTGAAPLPAFLPLGRRLAERFGSPVRELPGSARRALLLAALDEDASLAAVTGTSGTAARTALAPAERAGLVRLGPNRVTFAHPVCRLAVVHLASGEQRRRAHAALAGATSGHARARHLGEATPEPDDAVAGELEGAAGRAAANGRLTAAAVSCLRAAELSEDPADRVRRRAQAAYWAWQGGRVGWATDLVRHRVAGDPPDLAAAAVAAYVLAFRDGELDVAHDRLVRALDDPGTTPPVRDTLLEALLHVCSTAATPELWASFDAVLSRHGGSRSAQPGLCRDEPRGRPARERLVELLGAPAAERGGAPLLPLAPVAIAADAAAELRRALCRPVAPEPGDGGFPAAVSDRELELAVVDCTASGLWDEAEVLARRGLAFAESTGLNVVGAVFRARLALLAALRGRDEEARELADRVLRWATPRGVGQALALARRALALAAVGAGDYDRAYEHACRIGPTGSTDPANPTSPSSHTSSKSPAGPTNPISPSTTCQLTPDAAELVLDLVEAAVRTGRTEEARAHLAAVRAAGLDRVSPGTALLVAGATAVAAPDERADALFRAALALPGRDRRPFAHARIRSAYGQWLRRTRAIGPARRELAAALEVLERLGARPWAARVRDDLRATGLTPDRAPDHAPDRPARLTAQEESVARLAASGLTNKQIAAKLYLSDRTVGAHLYKVFPKLGVSSRTALRDALEEVDRVGTAD
ncbi:AAA family ATPase [Saccharothrix xinjiangensis]|uniref:AAA family ATPase n=1 Tax=Saccharothrix xinjiangensis TaxID=204798 RepID=A0ABV9Y4M6_9PSEU